MLLILLIPILFKPFWIHAEEEVDFNKTNYGVNHEEKEKHFVDEGEFIHPQQTIRNEDGGQDTHITSNFRRDNQGIDNAHCFIC